MSRPNSLRFRITALAVITSAAIMLAFGWLFVQVLTDRLVTGSENELAETIEDIEGFALTELGETGARFRSDDGQFLLALELDDLGDVFVTVVPADDPEGSAVGAFVIDSGTAELREVLPEAGQLTQQELREVSEDGRDALAAFAEALADDQLGLVAATADAIGDIERSVQAGRSTALFVAPLLVLASGLITWILVGRALAPTKRIAHEASAISSTTLHHRVSRSAKHDEVDKIAEVINNMLDRIEDGVAREVRFVADASHELRTPLAVTRMAAELAAMDTPDSAYPPQIIDEIDRMQQLVDDLLQLAREPNRSETHRVELASCISEAVRAHPSSQMITARVAEEIAVCGNQEQLRRVVVNLIDNASRFATNQIVVEASVSNRAAVIHVDDDGPGIDEADRARVFERFVRLDEGRSRTDGGSGLGLAIALAIIERHSGSIRAAQSPLGGARFTIELPLVAST